GVGRDARHSDRDGRAPQSNCIVTANEQEVSSIHGPHGTSRPENVRDSSKVLSWSGSPDPGASYIVEVSTSTNFMSPVNKNGPWTKLGEPAVGVTSFTDNSNYTGNRTYRIRAKMLRTTGSGSYYNLSQAAFK